jgi:hypothetical protein
VTDVKRLGKRGSYRLGKLRAQGVGAAAPLSPFRPSFTRPLHRGPVSLWLLGALAGTAVIAGGAAIGWWFVPFIVGLAAGLANYLGEWRARVLLPAVALVAIIGWAVPLALPALHGVPVGATARVIAALAGLPAHASVTIALTLLIPVIQALAGLWLGRALTPRPFPG